MFGKKEELRGGPRESRPSPPLKTPLPNPLWSLEGAASGSDFPGFKNLWDWG